MVSRVLGPWRDTQDKWSVVLPSGRVYAPERERLHDALSAAARNGRASQVEPRALVMAGGPASGKTTLRDHIAAPEDAVVIDADAVKAEVPEYVELLAALHPGAASVAHEESADVVVRIQQEAIEHRQNLLVDAVGDSETGKFAAKLERLRGAGYLVDVVYADVPLDIALQRNDERRQNTGRYVPEEQVRRLHGCAAARFEEIAALAWLGRIAVYACEQGPARLVAERRRGGTLELLDEHRFEQFLIKGRGW